MGGSGAKDRRRRQRQEQGSVHLQQRQGTSGSGGGDDDHDDDRRRRRQYDSVQKNGGTDRNCTPTKQNQKKVKVQKPKHLKRKVESLNETDPERQKLLREMEDWERLKEERRRHNGYRSNRIERRDGDLGHGEGEGATARSDIDPTISATTAPDASATTAQHVEDGGEQAIESGCSNCRKLDADVVPARKRRRGRKDTSTNNGAPSKPVGEEKQQREENDGANGKDFAKPVESTDTVREESVAAVIDTPTRSVEGKSTPREEVVMAKTVPPPGDDVDVDTTSQHNSESSSSSSGSGSGSDSDDSSSSSSSEEEEEEELVAFPGRQRGKRRRGREDTSAKLQPEQDEGQGRNDGDGSKPIDEPNASDSPDTVRQESNKDSGSSPAGANEKETATSKGSNNNRNDNAENSGKMRYCIGRKPVTDFVVGQKYNGRVVYARPFGIFVDIGCHSDAFCHVSRLQDGYVESAEALFKEGDAIEGARVIEIDRKRKRITISLQSDEMVEEERRSIESRMDRVSKRKQEKTKKKVLNAASVRPASNVASSFDPSPDGKDGGSAAKIKTWSDGDKHVTDDDSKELRRFGAVANDKPESDMTPQELKRARKLARRAARRAAQEEQREEGNAVDEQ